MALSSVVTWLLIEAMSASTWSTVRFTAAMGDASAPSARESTTKLLRPNIVGTSRVGVGGFEDKRC